MRSLLSFFLTARFFVSLVALILLFCLSFALPGLYGLAWTLAALLLLLLVVDTLLLYRPPGGLRGERHVADRLSNGDDNEVRLSVESRYPLPVRVTLLEEAPFRFQRRDLSFKMSLPARGRREARYTLRPTARGEYAFGHLNLYARTALGLVTRRFRAALPQTVAVYPSFLYLRRYELLAVAPQQEGQRRVRRLGHNQEFEQIRPYVRGDDYRTLNWRATARRDQLMVNAYQEERSQSVYALIDQGRVMQMPFAEMTLLDYAINATLALAHVVTRRADKAGLVTFCRRPDTVLPASRRPGQLSQMLELLYRQQTDFAESDYGSLYAYVRRHLRQRSLLLLFTNFETVDSLHRQLPYLRLLARGHVLVVVFFENTELRTFSEAPAPTLSAVYRQTIAEKFLYEKRLIAQELQRYGFHALLTTPARLTLDTLNKYLELKRTSAL